MIAIKERWSKSRAYRIALIAAIVYAILRFAIQVFLFADAMQPQAVAEGAQVSADLQQSYIPAAEHFRARQDIYLKDSLEILELHFPYSPAFAFLYSPILLLPITILVPLMVVLHLVAYWLFYIWWSRIFRQNNLRKAEEIWAGLLPMFLLFSVFWDDLSYLNIYLIIALFATFLIDAILREKLGWAVFWLGVMILPAKPHWAFAAVIPLLLGRYRLFWKLMIGSIIAYLAVAGLTMLAGGTEYVVRQYQDYFDFLSRLSRDFPWWGPDKPFLGYNHSIKQIVLYYLGVSSANMTLATIIKLLLLAPLGWVAVKFLRNPVNKPGREVPETALAIAFAFYLGAFIWLDMVWELSLGLVIFAFLLSVTENKWTRVLSWLLFAPYALIDIWRLVSYIAFGDNILYNDSYVLTDPLIYVPWIMMVLLLFYALLIPRLLKLSANPI